MKIDYEHYEEDKQTMKAIAENFEIDPNVELKENIKDKINDAEQSIKLQMFFDSDTHHYIDTYFVWLRVLCNKFNIHLSIKDGYVELWSVGLNIKESFKSGDLDRKGSLIETRLLEFFTKISKLKYW